MSGYVFGAYRKPFSVPETALREEWGILHPLYALTSSTKATRNQWLSRFGI